MDAVQMNTRLDAGLKARGDATLERFGKSATDAVRALWGYLATERTLPDFMLEGEDALPQKEAVEVAAEGAGLATRMAAERWCMPLAEAAQRLAAAQIPEFIANHFDLLHMEGDEAVFAEVEALVARREAA